MRYSDLKTALEALDIPFRPYAWAVAPASDYGVFGIDGQGNSERADGKTTQQALEGTVDLFCHSDSLDNFNTVQTALNASTERWYLNSVQYEEDTHLIHYEWVFQVGQAVS